MNFIYEHKICKDDNEKERNLILCLYFWQNYDWLTKEKDSNEGKIHLC